MHTPWNRRTTRDFISETVQPFDVLKLQVESAIRSLLYRIVPRGFDKSFSARGSRWRWRGDDPSRMKNQSGDIKIGRHFVIFTADHDSLRLAYDRICVCIYVQGETSSGGQTRFPNAYAIPPLNVLRHRVIIILLSPIVNDRASEGNNMR